LDEDGFASLLMSEDRKEWQNPQKILEQIGIEQNTVAADLGCGPGFFTIPLALILGKTGTIYSVDRSATMLNHLTSNLKTHVPQDISKNVKVVESGVSHTPIPDRTIELAIFANILHDLDDPNLFFDELKRILKSDSRIVDIDWHKIETAQMGPPMEIRLSENDSRQLIRQNGFHIVHALNAGPYHYGLVCKRN
jgi:ubiquinone/menaquinone biosynthesis C-methylase UbiE